jgi:hypothetical protein
MNQNYLNDFFERYNYHKITRYVDFNQGLDARLLTKSKAAQLSKLAIKPCRIAYDDLKTNKCYFNALNYCVESGIKYFSNYLLYNFEEPPGDLWTRLSQNIEFCEKHDDIILFSFPMKYADIDSTDRNYIGTHWNKKYLRAINIILNVTNGVVAKEADFFYRAFGHSELEFLEILKMPDEFIRYREFFDENQLTQLWKDSYKKLTNEGKSELLNIISRMVDEPELLQIKHTGEIDTILKLYSISKNQLVKSGLYYLQTIINYNELLQA